MRLKWVAKYSRSWMGESDNIQFTYLQFTIGRYETLQ